MGESDSRAVLREHEEHDAEQRTSVRARVVHEAIRRDGEEQLDRSVAALGWSALAAGLAMGFSLVTEALLKHHLPEAEWAPLISKAGYGIGFLIVIIGKQQLFTENTLTPMIPLMRSPRPKMFANVLRLWTVVFVANMIGAHLIAWFLGSTPVLRHEFHTAMASVAHEAINVDFWSAFVRGIPAGWLIAMIVWLRAATDSGEIAIILILTYVVALGGFTHIVAGTVEYLYLVVRGAASWPAFVTGYMIPVLAGNMIGGISIVAALNHAQVVTEEE
ncbi:MAG TPA: formate/nitrite transporter family protein [Bryobacteraceae bacterium]|nr:formate/nitrite transporter family protein [Bryobacteraceae bacterium]